MFIIKGMISGYIEFHTDDTELVKTIFGDKIAEISKSDYPTHLIVRFENAPEDVLAKLTPYWGQFEWILDKKPPV
jgi:hypothetical protein